MKGKVLGAVRFLFVTVGIIVLTSVSIDATEFFRGSQSALGILARTATQPECQEGMVMVENNGSRFCIDTYEVSVGEECVYPEPRSSTETAANAAATACIPRSVAGQKPWTHISRIQADQVCARAGKRLPTADEWYLAALGTPDNPASCTINGVLTRGGSAPDCRSGRGAYDMIGNVWEWVSDSVDAAALGDTVLPPEGYVADISLAGIPTMTTTTPQGVFNNDYMWSKAEGSFAVMRGGFHGSRDDAGLYAVHAAVSPQFESATIGFRCVVGL